MAPVDTAAARVPAPTDAPLPQTHTKVECHAGERRFFACSAKEGAAARRIVLCAADLGKPEASLALVFGDAKRTEDEIRVPLSADGSLVRYARYTRPLVTLLHIEMKRGAEVWDLSDEASEEGPKAEWDSRLVLRAPGRGERIVRCTSRSRESLMDLEEHLRMAAPWF